MGYLFREKGKTVCVFVKNVQSLWSIFVCVQKMWLERTNMRTSYPLPGIVGWYPVVKTETVG
jgi:hypothetical protein